MDPGPRSLLSFASCILPRLIAAAQEEGSIHGRSTSLRKFYLKVEAHLAVINETVTHIATVQGQLTKTFANGEFDTQVEKLLRRLERTARTEAISTAQHPHPYPKLQALVADSTPSSSDICGFRRLAIDALKDDRKKLLRRLDRCATYFTGLVIQQDQWRRTSDSQPSDFWDNDYPVGHPEFDRNPEATGVPLGREIEIFHNALSKRWACFCGKRHVALLRLNSCCGGENSDAFSHYNLLISHHNNAKWKRVQIRIERHQMQAHVGVAINEPVNVQHGNPGSSAVQSRNTQPSSYLSLAACRQRDQNEVNNAADSVGYQDLPLRPVGALCRLVARCQEEQDQVHLLAQKRGSYVSLQGKLQGEYRPQVRCLIPYANVIHGLSTCCNVKIRETDLKEKMILANVLAKAALNLYRSPWKQRQWVKERLFFASTECGRHSIDNIVQLYLSSDLDEHDPSMDVEDVQHPFPLLIDIGVLLLEIVTGKSIQDLIQLIGLGDGGDNDMMDRNSLLGMGDRVLRSNQLSNVFLPYREAIGACFNFNNGARDEIGSQRWIKSQIFEPTERLLSTSFGIRISPDGIRDAASHYTFTGEMRESATLPVHGASCLSETTLTPPPTQKGRFLDCEYRLLPDDPRQWNGSEMWFRKLNSETIPYLQRLRQQGGSRNPVRIAILDTGIDAIIHPARKTILASHPTIAASSGRIMGMRSWANDNINGRDVTTMRDNHGHGTHAAGLVLKVAPFAELFVAQITNGIIFEPNPIAVAQAIKYAAELWKVDVISMSFGFDEDVKEIAAALEVASSRHVILLAAASNRGRIEGSGDTYPAKADEVISIRSANGSGRPSEFNPDKPQQRLYSHYFNVVGEYVASAWPLHISSSGEKRASGTSIATPIAAGVVALMLEYLWAKLSTEVNDATRRMELYDDVRRKHNATGLRSALSYMTSPKDKAQGLRFLTPWLLISEGEPAWPTLKRNLGIP